MFRRISKKFTRQISILGISTVLSTTIFGCSGGNSDSNVQGTGTSLIVDKESSNNSEIQNTTREKIEAYRSAIESLLQETSNPQKYTSKIGYCMETSGALLTYLKENGFSDLRLALTDTKGGANLEIEGKTERIRKFHAFLVDRSLVEEYGEAAEIIIDPSFLQFVTPKPTSQFSVLLGTQTDIVEAYHQQTKNFHLEVHVGAAPKDLVDDDFQGLYPIVETVQLLYSRGHFMQHRTTFD